MAPESTSLAFMRLRVSSSLGRLSRSPDREIEQDAAADRVVAHLAEANSIVLKSLRSGDFTHLISRIEVHEKKHLDADELPR